jgi:hypothetical protein
MAAAFTAACNAEVNFFSEIVVACAILLLQAEPVLWLDGPAL